MCLSTGRFLTSGHVHFHHLAESISSFQFFVKSFHFHCIPYKFLEANDVKHVIMLDFRFGLVS